METNKREYAIEFKRVSYVTVYVNAESMDQAEELAWNEINRGYHSGDTDAEWSVNSSDEVTA